MGVSSWDFPNSLCSFSSSLLQHLPLLWLPPTILILATTSAPSPATTTPPTIPSRVGCPPLPMRPIPTSTVPTTPFPTQTKTPQPLTLNRRAAPATKSKRLLLLLLLSRQAHPRPRSPSQIQLDLTTSFLLGHNTLATTLESSLTKWPSFLQPLQPSPT